MSPPMTPKSRSSNAVLIVAAAASVLLMLRAGRHNPSILLMLMFVVWVSAPFAALGLAGRFARGWSEQSWVLFRRAAVVVAVGSTLIYGYDAVKPLSSKAAFIYLVVPVVSWIVLALVAAITTGKSRA